MTYTLLALTYIYGIQVTTVLYEHIFIGSDDDLGYDLIPFIQIINHFRV